MRTPIHFSEAEVAAPIDRMQAVTREQAKGNDFIAVQARAGLALMKPFALYLTAEQNRGTPLDDVKEGFLAAFCNIIESYALSCGYTGAQRIQLINNILFTMAKFFAQDTQETGRAVVEGQKGGHA